MPCDACSHEYDRHHAGSGLCRDCDCSGFLFMGDTPDDDEGPAEGDDE